MKIVDNYNLKNLSEAYGFIKNSVYDIYSYTIEENEGMRCKIIVKAIDRKVYFFYYDELEDWDRGYGYRDLVDYIVEIPDVLMKMIKDGVIECQIK